MNVCSYWGHLLPTFIANSARCMVWSHIRSPMVAQPYAHRLRPLRQLVYGIGHCHPHLTILAAVEPTQVRCLHFLTSGSPKWPGRSLGVHPPLASIPQPTIRSNALLKNAVTSGLRRSTPRILDVPLTRSISRCPLLVWRARLSRRPALIQPLATPFSFS